jgi:Uma2 family endonuclease
VISISCDARLTRFKVGAMNIHTRTLMTVEEFIDWALVQPGGRYELHRGRIVAMAPERVAHIDVKLAAVMALRRVVRASKRPLHALGDGATVKINAHTSYEPDALVYSGDKLPTDTIIIPTPVIVVEVLSPSTAKTDKETKVTDYFTVASIQHYLILDPEDRGVLHLWRTMSGTIARKLSRSGAIKLAPPDVTVSVSELFDLDA